MKFPLRTLISVVLVMGVLTACSSRSAQAPTPPPPSSIPAALIAPLTVPTRQVDDAYTAAQSVTPTPGPLLLAFWEEENPDGDTLLDTLAEQFMERNPDILVTRGHLNYNDLRLQFQAADAAGEAPTLVRAPSEFSGPFAQLGIIKPIDDLVSPADLDQFLPGALDAVTLQGRIWGLPDTYGNHLMLIYNRRIVTDVPDNTHDWIAQLKALTDPETPQYGLVYNLNEPYWVIPWIGGFGGWPLDRQDQPTLNTRSVVTALQFVHDLKFVHRVTPAEANYEVAFDYFITEKAAYIIDGAWNLARYESSGIDFGITTLPKISVSGLYPSPLTTGKYWFISRDASDAHLAAALQFIAFATSAEVQQEWLENLNQLPSNKALIQAVQSGENERLAGAAAQLSKGRGIPPAPEMRCVWDAMRPYLLEVMNDTLPPAQAAELMQQDAAICVTDIKNMLAPADSEQTE